MSLIQTQSQLELPESLQTQLREFRKRVWTIKIARSRVRGRIRHPRRLPADVHRQPALGNPRLAPGRPVPRSGDWLANLPRALYRWVWLNRHLEQLARLLTRKHPHIGDQLLGIIELVHSDTEQARSLRLCQAAVAQVADDAKKRDFSDAVPNPRHRTWAWLAGVPAVVALGLFAAYPAAASNAWARFLMPWANAPRYTFAAVEVASERSDRPPRRTVRGDAAPSRQNRVEAR